MQTHFTPDQLEKPGITEVDSILRKCVHCGFCTATCPTFNLLGDELDSPRGRIYLIKDMLENDRPADEKVTKHIDRCLSCLSCMTTCPSGVHYMHLVDHARAHIEDTYRRPFFDRLTRGMLSAILPFQNRFRFALKLAALARPLAPLMRAIGGPLKPMAAMLALAPTSRPQVPQGGGIKPLTKINKRVVMLEGCAQPVLMPQINAATERLLQRFGVDLIQPDGTGCCGSLTLHMGKKNDALAAARANIDAWIKEDNNQSLDAILITASGCGTTIKDYGHMFKDDHDYRIKAEKISALAKDITEFLVEIGLTNDDGIPAPGLNPDLTVAYHSACSMQHGQKITKQPRDLLKKVGFEVRDVPEGHLCCGSAGTYNILQSDLSDQLLQRKISNIAKTKPDLIATGNIGCLTQIGRATETPIVHTIELIDWAYGGPKPAALK